MIEPVTSGLPDASQAIELSHDTATFKVFVAGGRVRVCRKTGANFFEYVATFGVDEDVGQALVELLKELKK